MAMKYANIENIGKLISGGAVTELTKKVGVAEKQAADILKKLSELENAKIAKKLEEERLAAEKIAVEEAARKAAEEAARVGMENTKKYVARFGRAKSLMERAIGHQDAGATSVYLIIQGMREFVEDKM